MRNSIVKVEPPVKAIVVDAECDQSTGWGSYQVMDLPSRKIIFKMPRLQGCTNNIVEFLALVHGLAHCKKEGLDLPVYSDSQTAIAWVRKNHCNTNASETYESFEIFKLIARAENWLRQNTTRNEVVKWNTAMWGENPADFGFKR